MLDTAAAPQPAILVLVVPALAEHPPATTGAVTATTVLTFVSVIDFPVFFFFFFFFFF
jgi:hypothetical protein